MTESKKAKKQEKKEEISKINMFLIVAVAILMLFNQTQVRSVAAAFGGGSSSTSFKVHASFSGSLDLSSVDVTQIQSTAQGIAMLFPLEDIKDSNDAISVMIQTGIPEYGEAMGVSFDDPIASMEVMVKAYNPLKQQAKEDPEVWQRYLSLAAEPRGISCEFCCGIGAQGVDARGNLRCGCKHNPAAQTIALWLIMNTEYTDAQILREVYNWKALFFPRNMVGIAAQIAGGDTSVLDKLPPMVGGC